MSVNVSCHTGYDDADASGMQQGAEEESKMLLPADMYYKYEDLHSRPALTPDSEFPENLLHLSYPSLTQCFPKKHFTPLLVLRVQL